ncbi:MAG TPA: molybdenum cofactor guanylyltransferase [Anaerovoracaceae bacterium]|nr:molybdenum cofactor guanylyltransferase [Anaerovoracaceae bacterium]
MTGIILAGGNNSRMGMKKAFLSVSGVRIIDHTLDVFREIFQEIIIVTNTPADFETFGVKVVTDRIKGKGPLGGLYTGLSEARFERCFIAACDMPFLNGRLIRYMTGITGYDVVVPMVRGRYEPLFACYSRKCAGYAMKQIKNGNLKIIDIFPWAGVRVIDEDEMRKFDADLESLININTREELSSLSHKET